MKKFVAVAVFAFAFAFAAVASAMTFDLGTRVLRRGAVGADVQQLQLALNAKAGASLPGTTNFGPLTEAAVRAFQASAGLTADGIVGPATKKALLESTSSSAGGSSSALCPNGMTLSSNCTMAPGAQAPQALCPNGMTLSSNCTMAPGSTSSATLSGGAGDIVDHTLMSNFSNEEIGEGQSDVEVLGVEIEADNGSDIALQNARIVFTYGGNVSGSSNRFERYVSEVNIWLDGKKVGSAQALDFSRNTSGSVTYTRNISLSGARINAGSTGELIVSVSAINSINGTNLGEDWDITIGDVRFVDASGAIVTYSINETENFVFQSLATASNEKTRFSSHPNNPQAQVVEVPLNSGTETIDLLRFRIKAEGTNQKLEDLPVLITSSANVNTVANSFTLLRGGNLLKQKNASSGSSNCTGTSCTIIFDKLGVSLQKGQEVEFTVRATVKNQQGNYSANTTIRAEITATQRGNATIENQNFDDVNSSDRTGSAIGENMTLVASGLSVTLGSVPAPTAVSDSGNIVQVGYTIPVTVTAFGNEDLYIGQTVQVADTASGTNAFALVFQDSTAPSTSVTAGTHTVTLASTGNNAASLVGSGYFIPAGESRNFTIQVQLVTPATNDRSYRVALKQVRSFTDSGLSTGAANISLNPASAYQTGYQFINN